MLRRSLVVALLALATSVLLVPAAAEARFAFPKVSKQLGSKPSVGKARAKAPSKLKVKNVVKGDGPRAKIGDVVAVHYVGVLYRNGRQFDASWDSGAEFAFRLEPGGVIPGFLRGVEGMRVGGRRTIVIPPKLGYGAGGTTGIPGGSTLTFVVDLLHVG